MARHVPSVRAALRVHAHRRVRGRLEGEWISLHPGRSTDFNDLREYVRGDDVKDLDWKATARARTPLVRRYHAARKLTVQLVVGTGRSMAAMNDLEVAKRDLAVLVAGLVGHLAVRHGDLVALVHGNAESRGALRPLAGEAHLERCLAAAYDAITPGAGPTDLAALLGHVVRTVRRRTVLLVVCDETELDEPAELALRRLRVQHEVMLVTIGDLDPTAVPGERRLRDIDTGQPVPAWLRRDRVLAAQHAQAVQDHRARRQQRLDALGVVHQHVHDHASAVTAVLRLLERQRRAGRR
ncbi:DUF58 domain-containing protein [Nocardioides ferulae]|uniref:DUF58 domain-containing protein n=1 Tax=Nocardioides ferulae TaxID=2340821 RepID=UPI000EB2B30A|nr:DUF58 domain-containing protein [Nocardioides ferulae]